MCDFEYVQRCVATNEDIVVCLIPRADVEGKCFQIVFCIHLIGPEINAKYTFEDEEKFLSTDPVIHYDHPELKIPPGAFRKYF